MASSSESQEADDTASGSTNDELDDFDTASSSGSEQSSNEELQNAKCRFAVTVREMQKKADDGSSALPSCIEELFKHIQDLPFALHRQLEKYGTARVVSAFTGRRRSAESVVQTPCQLQAVCRALAEGFG